MPPALLWTPSAELAGTLKRFSTEGVAQFVKDPQDERAACFSLVLCDFTPFSVENFVELLNLATGFDLTEVEYFAASEEGVPGEDKLRALGLRIEAI